VPPQQWSHLKAGVLLLAAASTVISLVFLMSNHTWSLWFGHIDVRSYFENSAGLKPGSPVDLDGVTIGEVSAIHIDRDQPLRPVEVKMRINAPWAKDIPTESRASVQMVGLLGDTVVEIDTQHITSPPIQNGDVIATTTATSTQHLIQTFQDTDEQLTTVLARTNDVIDTLNSRKGSAGMLLNHNHRLFQTARGTVNQLDALVTDGQETLGMFTRLDKNMSQTRRGLDQMRARVRSEDGRIREWQNNTNQAMNNLKTMMIEIKSGKGSIGKLKNSRRFVVELTATRNQLQSIRAQISSGQGVIGQLVKNRTLRGHLEQRMNRVSNFMMAFRRNPQKYLTSRLEVF